MEKNQSGPQRAFRWRLLRRILTGVVVFLCIYALFGFLALPALIKAQTEKRIADKLQRSASIASVEVNPFTLVMSMHDFKLMEPDAKTVFASVAALRVNLAAESLLQLAPVIQQLTLSQPQLHLVRKDAHSYNFDDIVARLAAEPRSNERARFSINNIVLEGGRVEFDDQPAHAKHLVSDIRLGIPFISSLPSQVEVFVQPALSARVNDAPLVLNGKMRPFAATREAIVEFEADDLDLTRYVGYLPAKLRLRVPSGRLDLHLSASFRQQPGQAPALLLDGDAKLKSLTVQEPDGRPVLKLNELTLALRNTDVFGPRFDIARIAAAGLQLDLTRGRDRVWNLTRLLPGEGKPAPASGKDSAGPAAVNLHEFALRDTTLRYDDQYAAQRAQVEHFELDLRKLALDTRKRTIQVAEISSGKADWLLVTAPREQQPAPSETGGKSESEPGYRFGVDTLRVAGWSARIEDGARAQQAAVTIAPLKLTLRGLSSSSAAPAQLGLNAVVNQGGKLAAQGSVALQPLQADLKLDLKDIDLLPLQPYLSSQRVELRVTRGSLSGSGRLQLALDKEQGLRGGFKGDVGLSDLATVDKVANNDFLRWKSLALSGVDLRLQPLAVTIDKAALNDFFARVIIDPSGRINFQNVVQSPKPAQPGAKTAGTDKAPPVALRKLTLQGGRVRFTDNFIKPNYSASLSDFGGTVSGLSSDPSSAAAVDLHGEVSNAPLSVAGRINPLRGDLFLDLKANVRGMELAPLSPYSGRYIGYGIEKGKLSFEVAYRVEQRQLTAQNRLILDQLTFGEKIDSPNATSLPVQFAVSLLRDRNGVIDVNLPVAGSFDDPQFSVGGLLLRVIGNVITKAVTQPFALLGSLFGGSSSGELSTLEFEPGRAVLRSDAQAKLGPLAKALTERPALKLEIAGRVDPQVDLPGLRRAAVERKVRSLKAKDMSIHGDTVRPGSVTVSADEYRDLLRRVYRDEDFDKPRNVLGLAKDLPVEDMERLIAEHTAPDQDDLVTLGNQRAANIKTWLVKDGKVPAERIFLLAPRIGAADQKQGGTGNRAELSLR